MEMILSKRNIRKMMFLIVAVAILWSGTFGLLYHMNDVKMDGNMEGCLFDGPAEICAMNYSEHIATWQSMFTILPQNVNLINLLVLTILSIILLFLWRNLFKLFKSITARWRFYVKQYNQIDIFNSLKEAFSQGIINPKIYERAT